MALIKCHECGNSVSSDAKTCPSCGVKPKQPKKPTRWKLLFGIALFFSMPAAIIAIFGEPPPTSPPDPVRAAAFEILAKGERSIKASLRNPDSYEIVTALFSRSTGSVCVQYRAENGFGGMNLEHAIAPKKGNTILDPSPMKIAKECGENAELLK